MAVIKKEIAVGITDEIEAALATASAFTGLKVSQFARIALVEKLSREQFMQHPGFSHLQKTSGQQQQSNPPT